LILLDSCFRRNDKLGGNKTYYISRGYKFLLNYSKEYSNAGPGRNPRFNIRPSIESFRTRNESSKSTMII
jgi:hypothetical protein